MYITEQEKSKIAKYKYIPANATDYEGWNSPHPSSHNVFVVPWYSEKSGYWDSDWSYQLEFSPHNRIKGTSEKDIAYIDGKAYVFKHYQYYFDENGNELHYALRPDPVTAKQKDEQDAKLIGERTLSKRIKDFNMYYNFSKGLAIPICIVISIICILLFNGGWMILLITIPYVAYGLYKEATYGTRWK